MPNLTVVGATHARQDVSFTYLGETDDGCAKCRLRKQCHNLKPHHRYRITTVRPVEHDVCHVFEGKVKVVEVAEEPVDVHLPVSALRGTAFRNHFEDCGESCRFKVLCDPAAFPPGAAPAPLLDVDDAPVACKAGRDLRRARVRLP